MRLLIKFNLLLLLVFAAGVIVTGYVARRFLQQNAGDEVIQQARLMMGAAEGMRSYTSKQVGPLLAAHGSDRNFEPQRVPAYAATEVFSYLRQTYPAYTYKEAALNPTNPRDRAAAWEADVIEDFRNHSEKREFIGKRETPEGTSLFLARPISAKPECMTCHSLPASAPPAMLATYGTDNGFGWKQGEVVGAQIVSVPMSLPIGIANRALKTLLISLTGVFVFTLALLDLGLIFIVVHPVDRLSRLADQISHGNLHIQEIPEGGSDEISQLASAFNRMSRSLAQALSTRGSAE